MPLQTAPFQDYGAMFLSQRRSALLADDMGVGKTVQAIRATQLVGAHKILIVCPASVKYNWASELEKWTNGGIFARVIEGTTPNPLQWHVDFPEPTAFIINYDLLRFPQVYQGVTSVSYDVGIFDECDMLSGCTSKRTIAVLAKGGIASRCKQIWFLTGTPVRNRPRELYPILRAAAPHVIEPYLTYEQYARRYCNAYWNGVQLCDKGSSNEDELNSRLLNGFMLRRTKAEVLSELPPKRFTVVSVPPPNQAVDEYISREMTFVKEDAVRCAIEGQGLGGGGGELAIIRHELAVSKVPFALEMINDRATRIPKLVVSAYHRDVLRSLEEGTQHLNPVVVKGGMSAQAKHKNVTRFQTDPECRLFLAQISTAGVGINLIAASHMIFVESSWSPGELDQMVDRIHRMGQKGQCNIEFLVYRQSVEENMLRTVIDKKQTIKSIVSDANWIDRMLSLDESPSTSGATEQKL